MSVVVDVDFKSFKNFSLDNLAFFWTETKSEFVLVKVFPDMVVRTMVRKTTRDNDEAFLVKELWKHNARFVFDIVVDGMSLSAVRKERFIEESSGNIFREKPSWEVMF